MANEIGFNTIQGQAPGCIILQDDGSPSCWVLFDEFKYGLNGEELLYWEYAISEETAYAYPALYGWTVRIFAEPVLKHETSKL